jgi:hypothetical protein
LVGDIKKALRLSRAFAFLPQEKHANKFPAQSITHRKSALQNKNALPNNLIEAYRLIQTTRP